MTDEPQIEVPDYIPLSLSLPDCGTVRNCPKCGAALYYTGNDESETSTGQTDSFVEYHPVAVVGCPCVEKYGWPAAQSLGEHVCRYCKKCRYGWPERVRS